MVAGAVVLVVVLEATVLFLGWKVILSKIDVASFGPTNKAKVDSA